MAVFRNQLLAELSCRRITAARGNVEAEVDGHGNLTGLRLAAGALRLAEAVVSAVRRAGHGLRRPRPPAGDEPEELFTGLADEHRRRAARARVACCPHCGGALHAQT
ncbi:hypothetical protein [Amycolatopsis tucumanensis]|uniref:Uncharacterized protein n=1 Tax=Amycolatopsis tucumanensis TaxID=401106 RepID=A0ABP7HJ53_9PSEU|nr:hypothetical protein [Amycolatopsis tucumanensis]MCF6420810.1 hypothetical protein [Amycolatopsis tucumanensis]